MNKQFWNLWSSYALTYFGKVNLGIIIPVLLVTYKDLNMTSMGIISTGFMLVYAIGQILHGQISERFNPYVYISVGMILSGIVTFFLGFSAGFFWSLLILECFDGFFQSMPWSSIVRANAHLWKTNEEREKSATVMGCSYQFGSSITILISAFAVGAWGWEYGFWASSVFLIVRGLLLYFTKPKTEFKPQQAVKTQVKKTFTMPIVMSGISLMFLNMVRYGVLTWIPLYFFVAGNFAVGEMGKIGLKVFLVPIAGILGTLIYLKLPWKKDFTGIVFLSLMGVTWFLFPYTDGITTTILLLAGSAFLYGPHVFLVTTLPSRFMKDNVIACSTGFIDGMGYIGTVAIMLIVPYLVPDFKSEHGWSDVFLFWAVLSFVAAATVAITYFGHFRNNKYVQLKE
jgi:sugar phosphate permease